MFQNLQRIVLGMMLLLFAAVLPASAQAASNWLPKFDPATHVYVDPALEHNSQYPVDFSGMNDEVKSLQKAHNLEVFVIAVERDYDLNTAGVPARDVVDDLVPRWSGLSNFPGQNFMVVVWVRNAGNPNKGSVAAYSGPSLVAYGFDAARLSDKINGPVTPALKQFMPSNPRAAMLQVIKNVNNGIDQTIAARKAAEEARANAERDTAARAEQDRIDHEKAVIESAERQKQITTIAVVGVPSALVLGLVIFLVLRLRRAKAKAEELIAATEEKFNKSNGNYIELEGEYKPFLVSQGTDWKSKFKNKTLKVYTEAVGFWANLSAQNEVAKALLADAKASAAKANLFSIAGAERAVALLTTEKVTINGDKIPVEDRDYFGSEVTQTVLTPEELFASMADLFSKTGQALGSIRKSFRGAETNRQEIETITKAVDDLRASVKDKGLDFGPYEPRYQKIKADQKAFLDILQSDPLAAFSDSETVEKEAEALKGDIEHALKLKDDLSGTENELKGARKRVADVRAQKAGYNYPEQGDVPANTAANFLLNEAGANPDSQLDESQQHLDDAHKALLAGELVKAEAEKAASSKASAAAVATVDTVLAAKAAVEKSVPAVRDNLGKLTSELPASGKDVDALKADFLAKNFQGEPEKLVRATKVSEATAAELAKVKAAYYEQRYVAARKLMENAGSDVQGSRNALVEIATRLKQLRDLRSHAKSTVADSDQFSSSLKSKLDANSFTTSKQTDGAYAALLPVLRNQKSDVAKDITDWPAAADAADKLFADLKKVDGSIDSEKRDYQLAGERISAVRSAISSASQSVDHPDVRTPARQKLTDATQVLAELEASYRVAKSDWQALSRQADSKKTVADEAKRLAEADKSLANTARSELSQVESRITALKIRSWTQTATWGGRSRVIVIPITLDLSDAQRYLGQAAAEIRNRDYEAARNTIRRADSAADSAEQWADAQLAAAIQEQIREWQEEQRRIDEENRRREEEERRRREEEDRRRREEEDRRRRDDNNNSGGGNWGGGTPSGGGNVGGTPSGGDNY